MGAVRDALEAEGVPVHFVRGGQEALKAMREATYAIVAFPERLGETTGSTLLRKGARRGDSFLAVLLKEPGTEVPRSDLPPDTVILPIDNAAEIASTISGAFRERLGDAALDRIVGESERIRQIKQVIRQVAPTKLNVLITGESGTGKELVALAIHELSPRHGAPFVAVNAGALPEGVLESELFGHERGAFTGAHAMRPGRFELADRGTLFLDEIGDMPADIQVKLLRVLEESRFLRVGGTRNIEVDVRLITATNKNLEEAVEAGRFRHDLYFRLNVIHIEIPPLRERRSDIPLLTAAFVTSVARANDLRPIHFGKAAIDLLVSYYWPGNIRELRNLVEKLAVLHAGREVGPELVEEAFGRRFRRGANLPALVGGGSQEADRELIYRTLLSLRAEMAEIKALLAAHGLAARGAHGGLQPAGSLSAGREDTLDEPDSTARYRVAERPGGAILPDADMVDAIVADGGDAAPAREAPLGIAELERDAIQRALRRTRGNRRKAAALLGMGERTLYRKLREYGLVERPVAG
jgi:DNA-binding NtrC family response regulator